MLQVLYSRPFVQVQQKSMFVKSCSYERVRMQGVATVKLASGWQVVLGLQHSGVAG
jgi:hypothetical protein